MTRPTRESGKEIAETNRFDGVSDFEIIMLMRTCSLSTDESDKQFVRDCAKELARRSHDRRQQARAA